MKIKKNNRGFSLTELLVAMVIAGVVLSALYSQYLTQQRAYETTEAVTDAQQNLRAAMFMLERDIRMAGFDPTDAAGAGFKSTGAYAVNAGTLPGAGQPLLNYICFSYDLDKDPNDTQGTLDDDDWVAYKWDLISGVTGLYRNDSLSDINADSSWDLIANGISSAGFDYIDTSGVSAAVGTNIRIVEILLRAERTTRDPNNPFVRDLKTRILCRNMGL